MQFIDGVVSAVRPDWRGWRSHLDVEIGRKRAPCRERRPPLPALKTKSRVNARLCPIALKCCGVFEGTLESCLHGRHLEPEGTLLRDDTGEGKCHFGVIHV